MLISNEKTQIRPGDFLKPDEWKFGENLEKSDGFKDLSFPGCQFRLPSGKWPYYQHAVNITITGGKHLVEGLSNKTRSRCRIEFVGDGEPSTFTGGWIYQEISK